MKKILCFVLAVLMLFSLAACGKGKQGAQGTEVKATELITGDRVWTKALDADMDNESVKMHAYTLEAVKKLTVKLPNGTEKVIEANPGCNIVCITADVEKIGADGSDIKHMGAQLTADNQIYYAKRIIVPKKAGGKAEPPANLIFYANAPAELTPDTCEKLTVAVNLHQISLEDDDDAGLNRGIPRRSLRFEMVEKEDAEEKAE